MADQLRLLAPHRTRHAEAVYDIIAKTFPIEGSYWNALPVIRAGFLQKSHYDWDTTRVGFIGETMVTHFGVWDYQMRIGSARVRTAGIGAVATHGSYRKQGLMQQTAEAALAAARANGYDFSVLFGIRDFYHHFGYVVAWPEVNYTVNINELPQEPPTGALRRFTPGTRPDIDEVFNRTNALITGTAVRPTRHQFGPPKFWQAVRWLGDDGETAGYVIGRADGHRFIYNDSAGDAEAQLRVLGQLARKAGCHEVVFHFLPYDLPLAQRLRQMHCKVELHYTRNAGAMVALLNLPAALAKMTGEFLRRLQARRCQWRGDLLIAGRTEAATLHIDGTDVRIGEPVDTPHAIRGGDALARLLLGSAPAQELVSVDGLTVTGDAAWLLDTLFPEQHPMLPGPDRF